MYNQGSLRPESQPVCSQHSHDVKDKTELWCAADGFYGWRCCRFDSDVTFTLVSYTRETKRAFQNNNSRRYFYFIFRRDSHCLTHTSGHYEASLCSCVFKLHSLRLEFKFRLISERLEWKISHLTQRHLYCHFYLKHQTSGSFTKSSGSQTHSSIWIKVRRVFNTDYLFTCPGIHIYFPPNTFLITDHHWILWWCTIFWMLNN